LYNFPVTAPANGDGVVLVSELYPPAIGGSGVLLENLYTRLPGLPVHVLTHGEAGERLQHGVDVHEVSMAAPDWGLVRPACLRRHLRVARRIRELAPGPSGVVHCCRGLPEGLSAWFARRPFVCWTHGEELGFASTSRELTWLLRRVYGRAAAVLANSHNSARLLGNWGVPSERITVVHPGVDAVRFGAAEGGTEWRAKYAAGGEVLLLSVGRLQRRKGHDLALEAVASLRELRPGIRYLIAGDGPHRSALEAQAQALGLGQAVVFLGAVPEAPLPSLYAACDIFLMPNRQDGVDFEGFGIVFLEAAAAGKPAIGGRSGGVTEAIEDGVTGLLVSGTDVIELAETIRRLATGPDLRRRMGDAGRNRVLAEFTWERGAEKVAAVHRRVCHPR
jgi:phosphatidylinositol alpha-1,6-mannosyltransferase